jgi:hypothetical protein
MCGRKVRMPWTTQRDLVDAAAAGDAGVVAKQVDLAKQVIGRRRGALDALWVGDVADDAACSNVQPFQRLDGTIKGTLLDVGQHDVHARLRARPTQRKADAAGTAGYESRLAGKFSHGPLLQFPQIAQFAQVIRQSRLAWRAAVR